MPGRVCLPFMFCGDFARVARKVIFDVGTGVYAHVIPRLWVMDIFQNLQMLGTVMVQNSISKI